MLNSGGNPYEMDDQGLTAVDLARSFEHDMSADTSEYLSKMDEHYSSLIKGKYAIWKLINFTDLLILKGNWTPELCFWYVEVHIFEIPKLQDLERFADRYFEEF